MKALHDLLPQQVKRDRVVIYPLTIGLKFFFISFVFVVHFIENRQHHHERQGGNYDK